MDYKSYPPQEYFTVRSVDLLGVVEEIDATGVNHYCDVDSWQWVLQIGNPINSKLNPLCLSLTPT